MRKGKGNRIKGMILALCFLALAMVVGGASASAKKAEPIRIGLMPDVNSIIYLIAEQEGFFAEAGVDVELVRFQSANTRDAALQAGQIDGAVSDVLAALFALEGGFDVGVTSITEGRYALLASPHSGVTEPAQMAGKQVAVSKNTIIEYAADQIMAQSGADPNSLVKAAIPQVPVRMQMLSAGKLDAACLPDPLATAAQLDGAVVVSDSLQVHITPSVMVFRSDSLKSKGEQLKKVFAAHDKAAALVNGSDDARWKSAYEEMGFPESTWDYIKLPEYRPAQLPSETDIQLVQDWMQSKGLIKEEYSYSDIVDTSWLD